VLEDPAREVYLEQPGQTAELITYPAPQPDLERPVLFDSEVPVATAVVLALPALYAGDGARGRSVQPALALLATLRAQFDIDCRLATWNATGRRITELQQAQPSPGGNKGQP
jgi:hypothetical protein